MSEIQLFSYPTSPYAQKVGCYLKYKKLDFELVGLFVFTAEISGHVLLRMFNICGFVNAAKKWLTLTHI